MTNDTNDIDLINGKNEWVFLGKQPHEEMTMADIEKHRSDLRVQADKLMAEMESGNLPYGPLVNIQSMHQNLVFNVLLGKRQFEITGKHPSEVKS